MNNLIITTEEGSRISVTADQAPEVFTQFAAWKAAPEGSSSEAHLWKRVLEEAGCYLDDNEHEGEEVCDVFEDEDDETAEPQEVEEDENPELINSLAERRFHVTGFVVDGEQHYEVDRGNDQYGPMISSEFYWFARGVLADKDPNFTSPAPASVTHDALGIKGLTVGTPEQFLDAAQEAQTAYWGALASLESVLGVDVDSTKDLAGLSIEDLKNEDGE